jgi:protein-disulfide isomerase
MTAVTRRLSGGGGAVRPDSATVVVPDPLILGRADAPVTIVEYTDLQCPFCARHATSTLPELRRKYIAAGRVRYIVRDLPLVTIHPLARDAALVGRCIAELGAERFWAYHDFLFAHQRGMTRDTILAAARKAGFSPERAGACLVTGRLNALLEADRQMADRAGFRGTPAFVIGPTTASDTVRGVAISGAYPLSIFEEAINEAASKLAPTPYR